MGGQLRRSTAQHTTAQRITTHHSAAQHAAHMAALYRMYMRGDRRCSTAHRSSSSTPKHSAAQHSAAGSSHCRIVQDVHDSGLEGAHPALGQGLVCTGYVSEWRSAHGFAESCSHAALQHATAACRHTEPNQTASTHPAMPRTRVGQGQCGGCGADVVPVCRKHRPLLLVVVSQRVQQAPERGVQAPVGRVGAGQRGVSGTAGWAATARDPARLTDMFACYYTHQPAFLHQTDYPQCAGPCPASWYDCLLPTMPHTPSKQPPVLTRSRRACRRSAAPAPRPDPPASTCGTTSARLQVTAVETGHSFNTTANHQHKGQLASTCGTAPAHWRVKQADGFISRTRAAASNREPGQ